MQAVHSKDSLLGGRKGITVVKREVFTLHPSSRGEIGGMFNMVPRAPQWDFAPAETDLQLMLCLLPSLPFLTPPLANQYFLGSLPKNVLAHKSLS